MEIFKKDDVLTRAYFELTRKNMVLEKNPEYGKLKDVKLSPEKAKYLKALSDEYNMPNEVILVAEYNVAKSLVANFKI